MSAEAPRAFRFATHAQWRACFFEGSDAAALERSGTVRPLAPCGGAPARFAAAGAAAPAVTEVLEALWRDASGGLYRLAAEDDAPLRVAAPRAIARAERIAASSRCIWVAGARTGALECFEADSLTRRLVVDSPGAIVIDLAADGRDGVMVLIERAGAWWLVHVDCAGRVEEWTVLEGIAKPTAITYMRRAGHVVVLDHDGERLHWFARDQALPRFGIALNAVRPCFTASHLGSDARARLVVAGTDHAALGGRPRVLVLDAEGNRLDDLEIEAPATGVAASRDSVFVTTAQALLRFGCSASVSDGGETRATLITPMLQSPEDAALRRWLRVEALAALPEGATIEMAYAATDDPELRRRALEIAGDATLPGSHRLHRLSGLFEWSVPIAFHGNTARAKVTDTSVPLAAPLFDTRERYLWVRVTLIAAPGAPLPELARLEVLYPGRTLLEHLPETYRRSAEEPGSFLRALVGTLESTTQTLDSRIAARGSLVHPESAPEAWLDFIARWLGLPWDDALALGQKRCIVQHAADLAAARGTRAGLETLLACLMPGEPRRYRVVDVTFDYGLATLGGADCAGSTLPAVLTGAPPWAAEIGLNAVLGAARLPCPGQQDDAASRFAGHVRVDVIAAAGDRHAWEPWLAALIAEMVPVTVRVTLRWLSPLARLQGDALDGSYTLEGPPHAHLGTTAVTGLARLHRAGPATLPRVGLDFGTRLQ